MRKLEIKTKTKRNIFLVIFGILGFIVSTALMPETRIQLEIPEAEEMITDDSLPLPPIGPRDEGFNPLDEPFLFQLGSTDKMTGKQREDILELQYRDIVHNLTGVAPPVSVDQSSGMTVVKIGETPFATVLPVDTPEYYKRLSEERQKKLELMIGQRWKRLIEVDLAQEAYSRSEGNLAIYPYVVVLLFSIALIFHALADSFARRFLHSPGWTLKAFVWLAFLSAATYSHPVLKPFAAPIIQGGLTPVFLFLIIFSFCGIAYRIGCRVMESYAKAYIAEHRTGGKHLEQRVETMIAGGRFLVGTVTILLGFFWMMGSLGVNLASLFAGAGFAGVAIGVVGKDILIDYFFGINILIDDQFNIGDFIETPVATGTVEAFTLRTTRIRETDGGLSYVANSKLNIIKNHSREFANTDFRVGVAYGSDTDRCIELICDEIKKFAEEKPGTLKEEPVFTGVHELGDSAVVLRALVRTAALEQWAVGRELNRRVLHRFEAEGVEIPFPQRTVWMANTTQEKKGD
ncbi:MAG: mechanosensitive ion channel family protein [Candidatus Eremiobacteraeota bacterium]|nr:mechanosensitive ion channel family protein [Candidatus Eremiobacteraeota bacterium]